MSQTDDMRAFTTRCVHDAATDLRAKSRKRRQWADKQTGHAAEQGRLTADAMYAAAEVIEAAAVAQSSR